MPQVVFGNKQSISTGAGKTMTTTTDPHPMGGNDYVDVFWNLHGLYGSGGTPSAVLTWTLLCAPIAVQTRLTLYWYLRKIGGPFMSVIYNILNAVLFCILAGCMITVSAPSGIMPPVMICTACPGSIAASQGRPAQEVPGTGNSTTPSAGRSAARTA